MELPKTMKALQLEAPDRLVMAEVPVPTIGPDEVLIKTASTTICTSDLHDIKTNPFNITLPNILGHEGAGVVVSCGSAVKEFRPGMRIAAHPVVPCGTCVECLRNLGHLCSNMGHLGIDRFGTFAEYFVQRADRIRQLPDEVSFSVGSLLEPVANCLQAIGRSGDIKGREVLVVGDGPFGNIIARLASRAGASRVLVSGREPFRIGMIPNVEIFDATADELVDVSILAVSSSDAFKTCFNALRKRGRLVVFSLIETPVEINLFKLHVEELEIVGCCNDEHKIDESLICLSDSSLNLSALITQEIPFENWEEAFDLARNQHNKTLKVALTFK